MSMTEGEMHELDVAMRAQAKQQEGGDSDLEDQINALRNEVRALTAIIATSAQMRRNETRATWRDYGGMNCWRDGDYSIVVKPAVGAIHWQVFRKNRPHREGYAEDWAKAKAAALRSADDVDWTDPMARYRSSATKLAVASARQRYGVDDD